jgi:hypothetical protein
MHFWRMKVFAGDAWGTDGLVSFHNGIPRWQANAGIFTEGRIIVRMKRAE